MKVYQVAATAGMAMVMAAATSAKANVLLYSFEGTDGTDGFASNSGKTFTVAQSPVIGATDGLDSLRLATTTASFAGALTTNVPSTLTNPAVTGLQVDVTNVLDPNFTTTATYADLGVTLFVSNASEGEYGLQFQVDLADERAIPITPGTVTVTIPLTSGDPDTGTDETFGQLLANGFYVSGVELFLDKNGAVEEYVDNVQAVGVGAVPEPTSLGLLGLAGGFFMKRRSR